MDEEGERGRVRWGGGRSDSIERGSARARAEKSPRKEDKISGDRRESQSARKADVLNGIKQLSI